MISVEKSLWWMYKKDPDAFVDNFGMDMFKQRYAGDRGGDKVNPFQNATHFDKDNYEWQRELVLPDGKTSMRILCCPEDATLGSRCKHPSHVLCQNCRVPICQDCWWKSRSEKYEHRIPMALANDNFVGYTSDIIARCKVRWLEAAIVQPCWTNILIYYVEGDHGHLMNENLQNQRSRTVVRGGCVSYRMPWEDVIESLHNNMKDKKFLTYPLREECLKYVLRVHLQVAGVDMKKHLKQVSVRPHVLVRLLDYLIGQNHPVFHGKGSAAELQERMRRVIGVEYPETELEKPEDEREGKVPASIFSLLEDSERGEEEGDAEHKPQKRLRICNDKNATPGDGARSLDKCLEGIRPHAMCIDRSTKSASDPATQSEGALQNWGDLEIQTGSKMIPQFESSYFSEALPFVFPHVCGGPDFFMQKRSRRSPDAPQVGFQEWVAGMARRAESQFRNDWTALPMMRHVLTVWQSEHTLSTLGVHEGGAGSALQASVSDKIAALVKLYEVLQNGSVGTGHRA